MNQLRLLRARLARLGFLLDVYGRSFAKTAMNTQLSGTFDDTTYMNRSRTPLPNLSARLAASAPSLAATLRRVWPRALRRLSPQESAALIAFARNTPPTRLPGVLLLPCASAIRRAARGFCHAMRRGEIWQRGGLYPAVISLAVFSLFCAEYALIQFSAPAAPIAQVARFHQMSQDQQAMLKRYLPLYPATQDVRFSVGSFTRAQTLGAPWRTNAALAEVVHTARAPHPLLAVSPAMLPTAPLMASVRGKVRHHIVRMPVDKQAFHPLDKERFLAFASTSSNLRRMFAAVPTTMPDLASLEPRPASAIAPPTTRLDAIRAKLAKRRELGKLCALFESGIHGSRAIGYDPDGGTSYGKYQMSSRKGTVRRFIRYLDHRAPSLARRLKGGAANTGSTRGTLPAKWRRVADNYPGLFERLQDDFIHNNYYTPTLRDIRMRTGIDPSRHPAILREVLWSTAVQHGPRGGAYIFERAELKARLRPARDYHRALIMEIFRERERRIRRHSHPRQLKGLIRRLREERKIALTALQKPVDYAKLSRSIRAKGIL